MSRNQQNNSPESQRHDINTQLYKITDEPSEHYFDPFRFHFNPMNLMGLDGPRETLVCCNGQSGFDERSRPLSFLSKRRLIF